MRKPRLRAARRRRRPAAAEGKRTLGLAIPLWLPVGGLLLVAAVETGRIDGPHRDLFFNIDHFWILYALLPLLAAVIIYGPLRRSRVWRLGRPEFKLDHPRQRFRLMLRGGFGTQRVLNDPYSGVMHLCLMSSIVVLFLVTALLALDDYLPDEHVRILVGDRYLGYSLVGDLFGIVGLVGVAMAVAHRWVRPRTRLEMRWEDWAIVGGFGLLLVTGFLVEGLRIAASEIAEHESWSYWSPGGWVVAKMFSTASTGYLLDFHKVLWWFHMVLALGWLGLLGFTKLNHLVSAPVNAFLKSTESPGKLPLIANIEEAEHFGAANLSHFTMKQLFELDVCVHCGRCTAECPADIAGQPLSPMHIILNLKDHATDVGERMAANRAQGRPLDAGLEDAPAMVGDVIKDESLWACRTCGACVEECPVFIEHIPTIVDMRRNLVMEEARMPESVQSTLEMLERQGHPWRGTAYTRESWMDGLDVPLWTGEQEYLFFVGCSGALVDRAQAATRSVVRLLRQAGLSFGVLGAGELCNGDPARRLGNEYLFQILAKQLIGALDGAGVTKIVTHCPHCFNTFKNEYPDLGGRYEVIHHSVLLERLLDEGKLVPKTGEAQTVTFHDSCYLGRHNDIYDAPRRILERIPNVTLVEMPRNREHGLCCGAGGGNMWMEEQGRERVNEVRVREAVETGADKACTACPFCIQMFDSGIPTVQMDVDPAQRLEVFDVSEFLDVATPDDATPESG